MTKSFDWFQKLMKRSIHVNSASKREKLRLFKKMEQKVLKAERVESLKYEPSKYSSGTYWGS